VAPTYPLTEVGKKTGAQWSLTVLPTHLALAEAPGAQPYVILREQMMKTVMFMEGLGLLALRQPQKKDFRLTPPGTKAVADWLGKPFLASFYMNRRYKMVLPWAIVWLVSSLMTLMPVPGGGVKPYFDIYSFALGAVLLATWAFAKWRPHPVLFLVDSIWFLLVAVRLTQNVLVHGRSKGWLVLAALMAWAVVTGVKHFIRFRGTRIAPLTP
jgi:hypothetical protein